MVLKHHEAGFRVGSAGAGRGSAASCPTPRTPRVQPAQPTHTGARRETLSRTQEQQEKEFQWREKLRAEAKQRTEKVTMPWGGRGTRRTRRGGGGRGDGGWGDPKKRGGGEEGRLRTCRHCQSVRTCVTLSSLQTLSSSLKPTPLHSQSGGTLCNK